MARLALFTLPWSGHLHPMSGLAAALLDRGHQLAFFTLPEFAGWFEERNFAVELYGQGRFEAGHFHRQQQELAELAGSEAMAKALDINAQLADALLEEPQDRWRTATWDLWLVDQLDYAAASLARAHRQAFVTLVLTLLRNPEPGIPGFNGRSQQASEQQRQREEQELAQLVAPYLARLGGFRQRWGLGGFDYGNIWSELAQISQQPVGLEYPRRLLPDCFHFTGPFGLGRPGPQPAFPWHQLDQRPLVYSCFGTAQRAQASTYVALWQAVQDLPVQLVCSWGGQPPPPESLPAPPDNVLLVPVAPQMELLERASAAVIHAGMNSTLESLACGTPILALPMAHDQPGIALRIEWSGCGLQLDPQQPALQQRLRSSLEELLQHPGYRSRAQAMARSMRAARGLETACRIIETVARSGKPVRRDDWPADSSDAPGEPLQKPEDTCPGSGASVPAVARPEPTPGSA